MSKSRIKEFKEFSVNLQGDHEFNTEETPLLQKKMNNSSHRGEADIYKEFKFSLALPLAIQPNKFSFYNRINLSTSLHGLYSSQPVPDKAVNNIETVPLNSSKGPK